MAAMFADGLRADMEQLQRDGVTIGSEHFSVELYGMGDMKLQLVLYGRGAASSTFPCLHCDVKNVQLLASITTRVDEFDISFAEMTTLATMQRRYTERTARGYTDDSDDCHWFNQKQPPLSPIQPRDCPLEKLHLKLRMVDKFDGIFNDIRLKLKVSDEDYQRLLKQLHVFKGLPRALFHQPFTCHHLAHWLIVSLHWFHWW